MRCATAWRRWRPPIPFTHSWHRPIDDQSGLWPGPAGAGLPRHENAMSINRKGEAMEQRSAEAKEKYTEEHVVVRQVTHIQASWAERERGKPGVFTLQLILDQ